MHHLTFGINSLLHSVNPIVFILLLVHLILRISPHHCHHLCSHHLSLPPPFTPDLKFISFTNPLLHSHSYSFRTDFTDLNLYCIKGAPRLFVLVFFWLRVLDKAEYSALESTLNSSNVSYRNLHKTGSWQSDIRHFAPSNRSRRRQSSQPITWLILTNKTVQKIHKLNTTQKTNDAKHTAKQNYPGSVASYDTRPATRWHTLHYCSLHTGKKTAVTL